MSTSLSGHAADDDDPHAESSSSSSDVEWENIDFDALKRDTEALATWMNTLLNTEVGRLKENDVRALPLITKSVVTSTKDGEYAHTVTLATGMDFHAIQSIFLGPVRDCPLKAGFKALTLMLWTDKGIDIGMPFICAVLLPQTATEDDARMRVWRFTNDKDETVTHKLDTAEEIR